MSKVYRLLETNNQVLVSLFACFIGNISNKMDGKKNATVKTNKVC
jgi:hypothetical protein